MNEEMNDMIFTEDNKVKKNAKIKVIGVGGGGCNAVSQMINDKPELIDYYLLNTDTQALDAAPFEINKLILGKNTTKGLGAGGKPERGKESALDSYPDIQNVVKGADLVFIAVGEGGGTGTGAAPIVAKAAKEANALVVGIVTRPFEFEGKIRKTNAMKGIYELQQNVDALIIVSNDKLVFNNRSLSFDNAFDVSDHVLGTSVKTVTDIILRNGRVNLDFADVQTILENKGLALIGIGIGEGENKGIDAANNAINSPLLESSFFGAHSILLNAYYDDSTTLDDVIKAVNYVTEQATGNNADTNVIFGAQKDTSLNGKMKIAIVATDFSKESLENIENALSTAPSESAETQEVVKPTIDTEISEDTDEVLPDYLNRILSQNPTENNEQNDENPNTDIGE